MDCRNTQENRFWWHALSAPFIWLPLVFVILLDLAISFYQAICFPIYRLEKVRRSDYIQILDRAKLAYLDPMAKLGCMYCGYVNGVLLWMKEVAGRTEKYWCGIMHQNKPGFKEHMDQRQRHFAEYGNEKDFHKKYGN